MPPSDNEVMNFTSIALQIENTYANERGFLVETLDHAVAECAKHAAEYQLKTKLNLTLTFDPQAKEMTIVAELGTKLPPPPSFPIHAFVDREGQLVSEDPRQQSLPGVTNFKKER